MKRDSNIMGGIGIALNPSNPHSSCLLEKICCNIEITDLDFENIPIDPSLKEAKKLGYVQCYVEVEEGILFSSDFFQKQGFQLLKKNQQKTL